MIQKNARAKLGARSGIAQALIAALRFTRRTAIGAGLATSATAVLGGPTAAADLDMLTRLLIPAYIAQDFAAICATYDPAFLTDQVGVFASVGAYAKHVKKEVTLHLPETDAFRIRLAAANVARNIARKELRRIEQRQTLGAVDTFKSWCERDARSFVVGIVSAHEARHSTFDMLVRDAKAD